MTGELLLVEITCGGAALVDVDRDGDLDAYLLQGAFISRQHTPEKAILPRPSESLESQLYLNQLNEDNALRFAAGSDSPLPKPILPKQVSGTYACAVATGDVDNDGWVDLYVVNLGPNQLLRNLGDGRFEDVTAAASQGETVLGDPGPGTSATFFDLEGDGDLDLYVANYSDFSPENETGCFSLSGAPDYCGPGAYPMVGDRLYENLGDGTFTDMTAASGVAAAPWRPALGVVAGDWNNDGRPDLFVANDGQENNLWLQQEDKTFIDEALLAGAALNAVGATEASMGVDAGDYDNDGDLDLVLAHLAKETNTLYRNDGRGGFSDATTPSGLGPPSLPFTAFGIGFLDYDNDGWLDLFVANGAVTLIPEQVAAGDPLPLHQTNQLLRNRDGLFEDVTATAGAALQHSEVSRGAAFGDIDNDGDMDILVTNVAGPARLLVNQVGQDKPWLGVRLLDGERDALGAQAAILVDGEPRTWRRVRADGSYVSASDPRVLFALGDSTPDGVRVRWADGTEEDFGDVEVGRYNVLRRSAR